MHLRRSARHIAWRMGNYVLPPFRYRQEPQPGPDTARAIIVSFYMHNIPDEVVTAQRKVLELFAPPDVAIAQIRTRLIHSESINLFMRKTQYPVVLFLDIDCVPVRQGAIDALIAQADAGALAGSAQRSTHIDNQRHIYVAPSCMAVSQATFNTMGRPSAVKTPRGDVAEEFTYAAEAHGVPIELHWPVHAEEPLWPLKGEKLAFGRGTTFENGFWHLFSIREERHQLLFITRCDEIAAAAAAP